jgi:hypothetical protein
MQFTFSGIVNCKSNNMKFETLKQSIILIIFNIKFFFLFRFIINTLRFPPAKFLSSNNKFKERNKSNK